MLLVTELRLAAQRNENNLQAQRVKIQGPRGNKNYESFHSEPLSSCFVNKRIINPEGNTSLSLSKYVPIGDIHEIPNSVKHGFFYKMSNWYFRNVSPIYKVENNKGINTKDPRARDVDICLAKYSQKVAQTMDVSSACYTGVKHALWSSGVIDDYADMPKGSAYMAADYFDAHPEKFKKLDVQLQDLKKLPAGCIIVYHKTGYDGHIAITNGFGQEMSDCTDNMRWVENRRQGASFKVYRLTDNWTYNCTTKKLQFNE